MSSIRDKFERAGGLQTVRRYADAHVLLFAAAETAMHGLSQKSLEIVRLGVSNKVLGRLRRKNRLFIHEYLRREAAEKRKGEKTLSAPEGKIWFLWMDGMENAPETVQMCAQSLKENLPGREIVFLSEENMRDHVCFPGFIEEKYNKGIITKTHMSDLLRLELLVRHGGTWVDATVFCTGGDIPGYMLDSDLFLFQDLKPGLDGHCQRTSSWLITARPYHPILRLTRALLYEYWRKHDKMVDYFLLHDFLELAIETYPEEWDKVVPCSNAAPHILLLRLFEPCDEQVLEAVKAVTPFHKLTYKFEEGKEELPGTYYQALRGMLRK